MKEIVRMNLAELSPAEYSAREDLQPGDPDYEMLKLSIHEYDLVEPVVWNKTTGNIVSGHQRVKAALELGYSEDNVVVVDLPLEKEKALSLALNKIGGRWDRKKQAALLEELQNCAEEMLTGFSQDEIERIVEVSNMNVDDFFAEIEAADTEKVKDDSKIQCPHCGEWIELKK